MKKMYACALAALVLLTGCKEKKPSPVEPQVEVQEESQTPPEPQVVLIDSVMIAGGYWHLVTEGEDEGKMKWVEYAVPGTKVQAYGDPASTDSEPKAEMMRQVVRTTDKQKRDFIHITFDGHDYWAQDYSIVVNATPGVVMENNAYVFTKPSPEAMGDQKLDIGTVLGVLNDFANSSETPYAENYVRVNAYVQSRLLEGVYLSKTAVSIIERDLLTMQIYEKLNAKDDKGEFTLTDPVAREELFETVLSFKLSDAVQDMFLELYEQDHPGEYPEELEF